MSKASSRTALYHQPGASRIFTAQQRKSSTTSSPRADRHATTYYDILERHQSLYDHFYLTRYRTFILPGQGEAVTTSGQACM